MISDSYDINAFMKAMENKNILEIISTADREVTASWRRARRLRRLCGEASLKTPGQYEDNIKELIAFLRAAVTYRPSRIDKEVFKQFLHLRRKLSS